MIKYCNETVKEMKYYFHTYRHTFLFTSCREGIGSKSLNQSRKHFQFIAVSHVSLNIALISKV